MSSDCFHAPMLGNPQQLYALLGLARGVGFSIAPVTVYLEPFADIEAEPIDEGRASDAPPAILPGRRHMPFLTFARRRRRRRKSFTARARRQRRQEMAAFDALPIVRRARAAGLRGAALRAYVAAVERLDGPLALTE